MSEFPAGVCEEKLSADRIEAGENVDEKECRVKRDRCAVPRNKKVPKRNQELAFPHKKECQSHHDHGREKEGISKHGGLLLEGLVFAEIGDGESEGVDRDHGIRNRLFHNEDEVGYVLFAFGFLVRG